MNKKVNKRKKNMNNGKSKSESKMTRTRLLCLVLAGLMALGGLTTLFVYIGQSLS